MDREAIEIRIDELRDEYPDRQEFIAAIQEFSAGLDPEDRDLLAQVLLSKPSTGGFDEITRRREEGGWIKRSLGRMAERERKIREQRPPR